MPIWGNEPFRSALPKFLNHFGEHARLAKGIDTNTMVSLLDNGGIEIQLYPPGSFPQNISPHNALYTTIYLAAVKSGTHWDNPVSLIGEINPRVWITPVPEWLQDWTGFQAQRGIV